MLSKSVSDLAFVDSRESLPSVEVDLDSIPGDYCGFGDIVAKGLEGFAAGPGKPRATVYVLETQSTSFHEPTYSAFFVVAGRGQGLEYVMRAFRSVKGVRVRYSDALEPQQATAQFHIQDGLVWQPEDVLTWYASGADDRVDDLASSDQEPASGEDAEASSIRDDAMPSLPIGTPDDQRTPTVVEPGLRFRRARSDASLGTIRRSIEKTFGLPPGSVKLCGPDGRSLRSDASVSNLRKRWP